MVGLLGGNSDNGREREYILKRKMSVRYKIFGLSYKIKQQQQKSFHLLTWRQQGEERIWWGRPRVWFEVH